MTPSDTPGGTTDAATTVSERVARATAGLAPGGLDWAMAMDELAEELLHADWSADADGPADRAGIALDAAIGVRRLAIERLDDDLAATIGLDLRNNLAVDLASRYQAGGGLDDLLGDSADLDESITLHEGLLTNPAVAVDARPAILSNLANGLLSRFGYAPWVVVLRPQGTAAS